MWAMFREIGSPCLIWGSKFRVGGAVGIQGVGEGELSAVDMWSCPHPGLP